MFRQFLIYALLFCLKTTFNFLCMPLIGMSNPRQRRDIDKARSELGDDRGKVCVPESKIGNKVITEDSCSAIFYCNTDNVPFTCQIQWWFILIIVVALLVVVGLVACCVRKAFCS